MTLKELEAKLQSEGKRGYASIRLWEGACVHECLIGYFKDLARYHGLSYDESQVEFLGMYKVR